MSSTHIPKEESQYKTHSCLVTATQSQFQLIHAAHVGQGVHPDPTDARRWYYEHIGSAEEILHQHHWSPILLNNNTRACRLVALSSAVITLFCCCSMTKICRSRLAWMLHDQDNWSNLLVIGHVCRVRSLSLSFRLRYRPYVSNTKSILVERISMLNT